MSSHTTLEKISAHPDRARCREVHRLVRLRRRYAAHRAAACVLPELDTIISNRLTELCE